MSTFTQRELSNHTGKVLDELPEMRRAFITRNGKPVAVLLPIDEDALYDYVLTTLPDYLHAMAGIDEQLEKGEIPKSMSLDDLEADLGISGNQ